MKIALAQTNPIVGDVSGNVRHILELTRRSARNGADLVVFPELSVTGYPPLDLLESEYFIEAVAGALAWLEGRLPRGTAVLVGAPVRNESATGKRLFNAAVLLEKDRERRIVRKVLLPTYDVYDEYRYFESGPEPEPVEFRGRRLGIHTCEDMWNTDSSAEFLMYDRDPVAELGRRGVDIFINLSASPYSPTSSEKRARIITDICARYDASFVLVNQTGANTELVFEGDSRVYGADGSLLACAPPFKESLLIWDADTNDVRAITDAGEPCRAEMPERGRIRDMHRALVLGIHDYVEKTDAFPKTVVGLSGGIDSAVTAALAVEALGPMRVVGVTMPSRYSSEGSVTDSRALAENLGIEFHEIPIHPAVSAFEEMLESVFRGTEPGIAEENIQARSRGVALMALCNKFHHLLLTTGNKSELAMGYATLYGDMSGGLGVLSDVFKTDVYQLARYINERSGAPVIPESTIEKPPSAELRPDQTDQDSLPPYDVLDEVLTLYIEERLDTDAICERTGHQRPFIRSILRTVDRNEYKRRQAPPGLRVSGKAFGAGRRLPIVMRFDREEVIRMTEEAHPVHD